MGLALQIVLTLVLLVLAGCLVPLLLQLHRTAKAVELLAGSVRQDLGRIAEDVHQARMQVDKVAGLVERTLELPAAASTLGATLVRSVTALLAREPAPWLQGVVTALRIGLDLLWRPRTAAPDKEKTDE